MRLSTRLLSNAATTYLRLATTFLLGLFTTWYVLGELGVIGFGMIALAVSSTGPSHALERALRFGLVRELSAAIATGEPGAIRRSVTSAFVLCLQAAALLLVLAGLLAGAAWLGLFNTPEGQPELALVLAVLILGEGVHAVVRLLGAPFLQTLFAAQRVALDNLLQVVARASYTVSAVVIFGWLFADASLVEQLAAFAVSRATVQLTDVGLGIWLAKRLVPGLTLDRAAFDPAEYRSVRGTVWHSSQVSLLLNINPQLLAILINLFFGLAYNTIWQIAVQLAGFAWMLAEGLLRGIDPLTTHLQKDGRLTAVIDLMVRSIRYQLVVALPAGIFLGLWARPLLELWVGRRLANDPNLTSSTLGVTQALDLAATMAVVLLTVQVLRAGFFGIERTLYGMGKVRSYSWFSKWATVLTLGSAATLMGLFAEPLAAPLAMLLGYALYSPGVVLLAARRETGISLWATLRRSLPRPLFAGGLFLVPMALLRLSFDTLTLVGLAGLIAAAALVYGPTALLVAPEPDERERLGQLLRQGLKRIRRPSPPAPEGPPGPA